MPLQATSGAASYDAFGGGVPVAANYIEDVFSTYLYTGTGAAQTITNGIDLAGEGGLVWLKSRSQTEEHGLIDTVRGRASVLRIGSNSTAAAATSGSTNDLTAFNSNGFSLGTSQRIACNDSGQTYASWTFRKQPKFFDVVTYTGTGSVQTLPHNLNSRPCALIIKAFSASASWSIFVRGDTNAWYNGLLEATIPLNGPSAFDALFTTTTFSTAAGGNTAGVTYVVYLFASNAGGFGLSGTDNVISCGRYTANTSSGVTVDLGWEPQWLLVKNAGAGNGNWVIIDNMRPFTVNATSNTDLYANASYAEVAPATATHPIPTATGFKVGAGTEGEFNYSTNTFIYIAIRRGPMKVPTSGTSVFLPVTRTGTGASTVNISTGFPPDVAFNHQRTVTSGEPRVMFGGKLLGGGRFETISTNAYNDTGYPSVYDVVEWGQTSLTLGSNWVTSGRAYVNHILRRAPGFFDEVCYTGTGSNISITHNLQAVPQLAIIKKRDGATGWVVGCPLLSNTAYGFLNDPIFFYTSGGNAYFQNTAWSDQYLYLRTDQDVNDSGGTYVAYLFATCPGVSKVGSYTGNGATGQVIDCGFTGGARFVMIKRTDSTGDWYVWDTARGIVAGNDPHLSLNTAVAEVTTDDTIDTNSTGFIVNQRTATNVNVNGASYIFLAIA